MDIEFYGANCFTLSNKHVRLVFDDNLAELGRKSITKSGDVVLFTGAHVDIETQPKILIDQPGEYETVGVTIKGIAARGHMDEQGVSKNTMYKVSFDDLRIFVCGHIYPELTDSQLESIGGVDVMLVPVGGSGYTLDAVGALEMIKKVEPKLVIPTHYSNPKLTYPVPQANLEDALKVLGMEPKDTVAKLKLKSSDLSDITQLVILEDLSS